MAGGRDARRRNGRQDADVNVPVALPSRSPPQGKTLLEIASDRFPGLNVGQSSTSKDSLGSAPSITTRRINPDGTIAAEPPVEDDEPIGLLGESIVYSITFSMLFFTLDTLVFHQYGQVIEWRAICMRTLIAFPSLLFIIYTIHPHANSTWVQTFLMVMSSTAGCYLVHTSSNEPYFAVMQRAPPLGTLWIWSVLEMKLPFAVTGLLVVALYFWLGEFSIFT